MAQFNINLLTGKKFIFTEGGVSVDLLSGKKFIFAGDRMKIDLLSGKKFLLSAGGTTEGIFSFDVVVGDGETFTMPTSSGYQYNYNVIWGDENTSTQITTFDDAARAHSYTTAGTYTIQVVGLMESFYVNNNAAIKLKIIKVNSWGETGMFKQLNFEGCQNLSLPEERGKLINVESFLRSFSDCKLTSIPTGLIDNNIIVEDFSYMFAGCNMTSIPSGLFDTNISATNFDSAFTAVEELTSIPTGLFDKNILVTNFSGTFAVCLSLTSIPVGLFDKNIAVETFKNTFQLCFLLTGSSRELWLNPSGAANYTLTGPNYDTGIPTGQGCYFSCSGLDDYATIPTYWK